MQEAIVFAPAKINLCLHVRGRRQDGYHEVAMMMQRVSLCDEIHLEGLSEPRIEILCPGLELNADEENIAVRAARLLLHHVGGDQGVKITINKRIPVAAGLGGGSSDAAGVLLGLNQLFDLKLDQGALMNLGARLGADVPFFIFQRPAWATGIGTTLAPLPPLPQVAYLLVNPGFAVSTAEVYRSLQLTKGGELASLPRFSVVTRTDLRAVLHNDLEPAVLARYTEIAAIKHKLIENGALGALMSGSGGTVFGVYEDVSTAAEAGARLAAESDWLIFPVEPVD